MGYMTDKELFQFYLDEITYAKTVKESGRDVIRIEEDSYMSVDTFIAIMEDKLKIFA